MQPDRVIGVDVGGTKVLAGIVSRDGSVHGSREVETPVGGSDELLAALDDLVDGLVDDHVAAIGYGVPFTIDRATGIALRATNLSASDIDFVGRAQARYELPVGLENDGNAAALAEWRLGAGRGTSDLMMLTLGTGVGGGLVLESRLYRGWAELGHVVVVADGPLCQGNCHGRGHLEAVASGHAATEVARRLYGDGADAHLLVERAHGGDPAAVEALDGIGALLGVAIGSLANVFAPDVVVIGGGFGAAAGDLLLVPAEAAARREAIRPADESLCIVSAELGDAAGLVGAGLVAFEALDGER
jgi:glucokinase